MTRLRSGRIMIGRFICIDRLAGARVASSARRVAIDPNACIEHRFPTQISPSRVGEHS
jgi:hypothetical protein